jgi:plastocyanin
MPFTKLIIAAVIVFLGVGCAKTTTTNTNKNQPPAIGTSRSVPASGEMTVTIDQATGEFIPVTSFIKKGTKVIFKNTTDRPHRIVYLPDPAVKTPPDFGSKTDIAPGESYVYTFNEIGRWLFNDALNPGFSGGVEVVE